MLGGGGEGGGGRGARLYPPPYKCVKFHGSAELYLPSLWMYHLQTYTLSRIASHADVLRGSSHV